MDASPKGETCLDSPQKTSMNFPAVYWACTKIGIIQRTLVVQDSKVTKLKHALRQDKPNYYTHVIEISGGSLVMVHIFKLFSVWIPLTDCVYLPVCGEILSNNKGKPYLTFFDYLTSERRPRLVSCMRLDAHRLASPLVISLE